MKASMCLPLAVFAILIQLHQSQAQIPPRLNIPGAVLLAQPNRQRISQQPEQNYPSRPRRIQAPIPQQFPREPPIRPVFEETVENEQPTGSQFLDDEVSKLGLAALQTAVRQQNLEAEEQEPEPPRPVQFRPERPIPVLRQDIRENNIGPSQRQVPISRQEQPRPQLFRPNPSQRQEIREDEVQRPQPARQTRPQAPVQQPPQQFRQTVRVPQQIAPRAQYAEDDSQRKRKPPVQILRKFRTDNEDGSISWGYENEDGTFKEETLGNDCITRGKYGYVDPDGVKREYTYESGLKCDEPEEEELQSQQNLPPQAKQQGLLPRKQQFRPQSQ